MPNHSGAQTANATFWYSPLDFDTLRPRHSALPLPTEKISHGAIRSRMARIGEEHSVEIFGRWGCHVAVPLAHGLDFTKCWSSDYSTSPPCTQRRLFG